MCLLFFFVLFGMSALCQESIIETQCSSTKIEIYPSGLLKSSNVIFYYAEEVCLIDSICFNQVHFLDIKNGMNLISNSFPNTWYTSGKVHKMLSYTSSGLIVYQHYDENGKLIGEEFFKHNPEQLQFFEFTGTWWKLDGRKKRKLKELPDIYAESYFDY